VFFLSYTSIELIIFSSITVKTKIIVQNYVKTIYYTLELVRLALNPCGLSGIGWF
jgi:hypothetical protein